MNAAWRLQVTLAVAELFTQFDSFLNRTRLFDSGLLFPDWFRIKRNPVWVQTNKKNGKYNPIQVDLARNEKYFSVCGLQVRIAAVQSQN